MKLKYFIYINSFIYKVFLIPGSDNDECTIADDSLLLVDDNDIRELSSAGLGRRLLDISVDCIDSWEWIIPFGIDFFDDGDDSSILYREWTEGEILTFVDSIWRRKKTYQQSLEIN